MEYNMKNKFNFKRLIYFLIIIECLIRIVSFLFKNETAIMNIICKLLLIIIFILLFIKIQKGDKI